MTSVLTATGDAMSNTGAGTAVVFAKIGMDICGDINGAPIPSEGRAVDTGSESTEDAELTATRGGSANNVTPGLKVMVRCGLMLFKITLAL